ncbi:HNH endonuclease [Ectothiorhodospiraceae bacterium BW-2]|nr:HNH endonuclease [Ectothiorhodospiraceae bacterium BW-2]
MNNRGEQLEKHEVLKAKLMAVLNEIEDKTERDVAIQVLSKVWDAASNMERYIQYGFTINERYEIFGGSWGKLIPKNFTDLTMCITDGTDKTTAIETFLTMEEILANPPQKEVLLDVDPTKKSERFNSVINFSNFLLHVLRVCSRKDIPLDDKRLLEQFETYILKSGDAISATKSFIFALLKVKYLFDHYIIKREFTDRGDHWSLKRLKCYNQNSQSYINTFDEDAEDGFEGNNRRILMLLSAFHVSTPTLVYKHWLNGALSILYEMTDINAGDYLAKLEHLARQFVYGRFLSVDPPAEYYPMIYENSSYAPINRVHPKVLERLKFSHIENNLVFNYLDYLIWCNAMDKDNGQKDKGNCQKDEVIKQFEYSFRSSVEHFYPQHPIDGHPKLDECYLHRFGNLCLISHSKNSRLSNLQPRAKRDHFQAAIRDRKIDTLKLYKMIKLMDENGQWYVDEIAQHEADMLQLFVTDSAK